MVPASPEQQTALQIIQTNNSIANPEQLALLIVNPNIPKFGKLSEGARRRWLGEQINALNYMVHATKIAGPVDLTIEASLLDQSIMEDDGMSGLTQIEIQDAFRKGITREYGDFFGITTASLVGFLRGYLRSDKRQKALAILHEQEVKRIAEEKEKETRLLYELRARNLQLPFWNSTRNKKKVTAEESAEHRKKIEQQRNEILKQHNNGSEKQ